MIIAIPNKEDLLILYSHCGKITAGNKDHWELREPIFTFDQYLCRPLRIKTQGCDIITH